MNTLQVEVNGWFNTVHKTIRKLDKDATAILTSVDSHYSENYEVPLKYTFTVFHGMSIVYSVREVQFNGSVKQFKQLAVQAYRDWLNKQNSTA